jgi:transcriptional regulator with XRE-family HTH domain
MIHTGSLTRVLGPIDPKRERTMTKGFSELNPQEIRRVRGALNWSVERLAQESGVSASTIKRIEKGGASIASTINAILSTLEKAGIDLYAHTVEIILSGEEMVKVAAISNKLHLTTDQYIELKIADFKEQIIRGGPNQ